MVVLHHFVQIFFQHQTDDMVSIFFAKYGAMGVDIFFVISGFVMYKSTHEKTISPHVFIFNRLARIVPAYWFFTFLTLFFLLAVDRLIPFTEFELIFFIKSLFFVPAQNPFGDGFLPLLTVGWTLNLEMAFYAIFAGALFFRKSHQFAVIMIGIIVLENMVPRLGSDFSFYHRKIVFEFLVGIIICIIYQKNLLKIPLIPALIVTLLCLFVISKSREAHDNFNVGIPFAVIVAMTISQEKYLACNRWLIHLGDWSYSTYLCHTIVLALIYRAVQNWNLNNWFILPFCLVSISAVSWVSYTCVERKFSRFITRKDVSISKFRTTT